MNQTFTITLGDVGENHVGMQKVGSISAEGFSLNDLEIARDWFRTRGSECGIVDLAYYCPGAPPAYVLVARRGLDCILSPQTSDDFYREQDGLEKDTKAKMRGRVVNKKARYNLCFGMSSQEPDYVNGMGRVVAFNQVPLLETVMRTMPDLLGEKGYGLVAEGNYYYDLKTCGIGFHGDAERRKVVGIRVGATMPLHYQWFLQTKSVGYRSILHLGHGDIYIMSDKATGHDWRTRKQFTLRHAAGAEKYLQTNN